MNSNANMKTYNNQCSAKSQSEYESCEILIIANNLTESDENDIFIKVSKQKI